MRYIKFDDDESYSQMVKLMVKDFDSYQYISNNLNIILNEIDDDIDYFDVEFDDIYINIEITLNDYICYGFDYDNKNYSLLSFKCDKISINNIDTIIKFDDNIIIDLSNFKFKNFVRIE